MEPSANRSRRTALVAMGSAAAVATLRPAALAAASLALQAEFVVITDTHLGYKGGESAARQWAKTAEELKRAPGDFILHLGDIVDGQREPQYAVYLATARQIGKPIHAIPGNHDPAEMFARHIRPTIDTSIDRPGLKIVLLGNAHTDSHDGFLTAEQLDWLDQQCQAAAQAARLVIVCMHVPAHSNRHPDRGWYVKPDQGQTRLYELLAKHQRQVVALFHGHFHNGIRGWDDHPGVQEICFPSALYNQSRRLAEQGAPGYNLDEFRPGYTLVKIANGQMTLRYKPVGNAAEAEKTLPINGQGQ